MSDQVPPIDPAGERPQNAEDPVPNPHRNEPVPRPEEGMRPGIDPAVRPEQDEEFGPAAGLVASAATSASEEATEVTTGGHDPESERLLAQMGVEEEGIESGQLLGLIAVVLLSVAALAVVLIYLFYIPYRTQVGLRAEGEASYYEIEDLRTEAVAKLSQYTRTDETYGLPIGRAMGLVAAEYGGAGADPDQPDTRPEWNLVPVMIGTGEAIQATDADPRLLPPTATELPDAALTGERVGQDVDADATVDLIDNDADVVREDVDIDDVPDPVTPLRDSN